MPCDGGAPLPGNGADIRVIDIDGDPWFVAKDVAQVLGYATPQKAVRDHCKASTTVPKRNGGYLTIIPERDVYRLIMRSKLPAAEAFEDWVVGTVLPAIRKDGGYVRGEEKVETEKDLEALALRTMEMLRKKLEEKKKHQLGIMSRMVTASTR